MPPFFPENQLNSLGYRTDLIFVRFQGIVEDCGDVIRAVSPASPAHYYGNFLIFKRPPQSGDRPRWEERFAALVGQPPQVRHQLFGWDLPTHGEPDLAEFLEAGYLLDEIVVMSTPRLQAPLRLASGADLQVIPDTDAAWAEVVDLQVICRKGDGRVTEAEYRTFKESQFRRYRAMVGAGLGCWYGAFVAGRLVADLGVFSDGAGLLRFQAVETHPAYRRRGLCGTLTYFAGEHAQQALGGDQLVIVADEQYFAKEIYQSVGFSAVEHQRLLFRQLTSS